jgi:hypothetical protein
MAGFVGTVIGVTQAVSGPAPNGLCVQHFNSGGYKRSGLNALEGAVKKGTRAGRF